LVQPSCAWSGRATANRRAKPSNVRVDFVIDGLHLGSYWHKTLFVNEQKMYSVIPFGVRRRMNLNDYGQGLVGEWSKINENQHFSGFYKKCFPNGRSYP
jgi:hypothetical protein